MKKYLICLIVLFSAFLGFSNVSAEISECSSYTNCSEAAINKLISTQIAKIPEYKYFIFQAKPANDYYKETLEITFFKSYSGFVIEDGKTTSDTYYKMVKHYEPYYKTPSNLSYSNLASDYNLNLSKLSGTTSVDYPYGTTALWSTRIGKSNWPSQSITYTNIPTLKQYDNSNFVYNNDIEEEFYEFPKQGGNTDKIYSIDYTFTPETYNSNTKIKYEIDYDDNYNHYSNENVEKYLYIDNFYFYGLVNNNGLYHYEKLGTTSGSYIDDYVEKYENGKYYLDINSFNLDFSNYEKIILRTQFLADGNLISVTSFSNNNKITNNDVFYNTVFGEKYLNMNIDTSNSLYLDLSTDLDVYNSRYYVWGCDFSNPYKYPYILYFSTETSLFLNESITLELEYTKFLGYDTIAASLSDFQIGKSNKKAVALTRDLSNNSDINFNYNFVFDYNNLYFSYNNEKTHSNKIYMDHNGNWFQDDNVNAENSNIPSSSNILNLFKDFIQHLNNNIFTLFNQIWILLRNYRIFLYFWILIVGAIICLIIKSANRK